MNDYDESIQTKQSKIGQKTGLFILKFQELFSHDKWKQIKKQMLVNTIIINAAAQLDTTESISDDETNEMMDFDDDSSELVRSSRHGTHRSNTSRRANIQLHHASCPSSRRPPRYSYPNQTIPEYFLPDESTKDAWKMGPPPAFVSKSNSEVSFGKRSKVSDRSSFSRGASLQSDFSSSSPQNNQAFGRDNLAVEIGMSDPLNTRTINFRESKTPSPPAYTNLQEHD